MRNMQDILREARSQEYTYTRFNRCKAVESIASLSYDAAIEVARANSMCDTRTAATCPYMGGLLVLPFLNGKPLNPYICDNSIED